MAEINEKHSQHSSEQDQLKQVVQLPTAYEINERRRAALDEIDNAKFSWFHVKVVLVAGVGFFTDAYDIFAINIASTMLGYIYGPGGNGLTPNQDLGIKVATPVGTFVGQLLFGWLADVVGRKRMYGVELMIIIIATFAQAIAGHAPAVSFIGVMVVWRFLAGVGIGGDYPLSAVISSEFSSARFRGRVMTAVFAAQGFGNFAAAAVAAVTIVAYKDQVLTGDLKPLDQAWRILIGLGCVPGVIALYFRLTISETPRFTMDIEANLAQATSDMQNQLGGGNHIHPSHTLIAPKVDVPKATFKDFVAHFGQWKNGKVLFGAAWSWFALDIAFYGLGLNSSIVLSAANFGGVKANPTKGVSAGQARYKSVYNASVGNMILSAGGLIPGYWATFLFIDSWGRKPIQLMGFVMLTALFCAMGFGYHRLQSSLAAEKGFLVLYCFANFFQNFGPNTTTFIIPGEVFPTRYRSTAHGISAASGKLGAIIAQVGFARLRNIGGMNAFVGHILEIFALFMLTGIFSTLLLPETKGRTLEELSNEEQDNFAGGIAEKPVNAII